MADEERLTSASEHLTPVSGLPTHVSERPTPVSESLAQDSERMTGDGHQPGEVSARLICASGELLEGGDGARFEIERMGETVSAFAVRYGGRVYAYLNRCTHIELELDWKPGKFFDADGEYLICSTHGALYAPESGACRGGPCRGAALTRLEVFEADGNIYVKG